MADRSFSATRLPGFATVAIAAFVLLYLPIITLVTYSFNASNSISDWGGFSWHWYIKAWDNDAVKSATLRSLIIAVMAALIATTVATMAALGTTRRAAFKGQTFIYVVINQPLMVPEIVTAVALLIMFGVIKTATGYQGLGYLIIAHAAFCTPFAYLPGWRGWICHWKRRRAICMQARGKPFAMSPCRCSPPELSRARCWPL
jgi:spermidine/putrescine transport system permease protein